MRINNILTSYVMNYIIKCSHSYRKSKYYHVAMSLYEFSVATKISTLSKLKVRIVPVFVETADWQYN